MVSKMGFYDWVREKFKFQAFMLMVTGIALGIAYLLRAGSKSSIYRYSSLPKKCVCPKCGYTVVNPNKHCREILCPKCKIPLRRVY